MEKLLIARMWYLVGEKNAPERTRGHFGLAGQFQVGSIGHAAHFIGELSVNDARVVLGGLDVTVPHHSAQGLHADAILEDDGGGKRVPSHVVGSLSQ